MLLMERQRGFGCQIDFLECMLCTGVVVDLGGFGGIEEGIWERSFGRFYRNSRL